MSTPLVVSVTDELVAELEAIAKLATPGPWVSRIEHDSPSFQGYYVSNYGVDMYAALGTSNQDEIDASYIATANPATIIALLAERAELLRDAERYRFWRYMATHEPAKMARILAYYESTEQLDTAIDAAMQSEAKQ